MIQIFHLKESVYKMLLQRYASTSCDGTHTILRFLYFLPSNDLELQFKCYHHDDKQLCNWPIGVSVKVNEHALTIDRVSLPILPAGCVFTIMLSRVSLSTCIVLFISSTCVYMEKTCWRSLSLIAAV